MFTYVFSIALLTIKKHLILYRTKVVGCYEVIIGGSIKRCFCLTSVCLSVAYIGPNSRTERPRKTKIGTEVTHITHDSDTTFRVKRSKVKVTRPLWLAVQVTT